MSQMSPCGPVIRFGYYLHYNLYIPLTSLQGQGCDMHMQM